MINLIAFCEQFEKNENVEVMKFENTGGEWDTFIAFYNPSDNGNEITAMFQIPNYEKHIIDFLEKELQMGNLIRVIAFLNSEGLLTMQDDAEQIDSPYTIF